MPAVLDIPMTRAVRETLEAYRAGRTLIANVGGTRSGKTYSIMEVLLLIALTAKKDIDIVSESLPHLKKGALKDLHDIIGDFGLVAGFHYDENKTDRVFTFARTGSVMRFFSAEDWGKVKGSRRDILFVNEANRIPFETFRQLSVRTAEVRFIDWNPDSEFWFEEKGLDRDPATKVIRTTYKDNPFLGAVQIAEIERNRGDENWWRVYGLGLTGSHEGVIYKRLEAVDALPADRRGMTHAYGLDFGYTNDPTALVEVLVDERSQRIYADEMIYEAGLLNRDIARRASALNVGRATEIFADSAEPKSIDELRRVYGFNVKPSYKHDLLSQIQFVQGFTLCVTRRSLNLIREARNYKWKTDRDGAAVNEPVDVWNHALDALRYAVYTPLRSRPALNGGKSRLLKLSKEMT